MCCSISSSTPSGVKAMRALGMSVGAFQNQLFVETGVALDDEALIEKGRHTYCTTGPAVLCALLQNGCGFWLQEVRSHGAAHVTQYR